MTTTTMMEAKGDALPLATVNALLGERDLMIDHLKSRNADLAAAVVERETRIAQLQAKIDELIAETTRLKGPLPEPDIAVLRAGKAGN